MSIIEYETWTIKEGCQEDHDKMIRAWFAFVKDNYTELFPEWKSARYYREIDADGRPTGKYIMLFEFFSIKGHHEYKERRKDFQGPYEAYKKVDPYQYFNIESVNVDFWEPLETNLWLDFGDKGGKSHE